MSVMEKKKRRGTNWLEGVTQFMTYDRKADKLFMAHLFGVACNGRLCKYGIPGASASYFNEWKDSVVANRFKNPILAPENNLCKVYQDEEDGLMHFDVERLPNGDLLERMKFGIIGLLQPERVLDILQHFIVFERDNGKIIKKVARYQQLRAANKIVERVTHSDKSQGVIWHTQGSGKSLTMLYTANKLRKAAELNDPTIYLVFKQKGKILLRRNELLLFGNRYAYMLPVAISVQECMNFLKSCLVHIALTISKHRHG